MTSDLRQSSGTVLHGHRAGFASRVAAAVIDLVAITLLCLTFLAILALARYLISGPPLNPPTVSRATEVASSTGLAVIYLATGWAIAGRTVGMQILGLRLISRSGKLLRPARALVRAALCLVFPAGLLWVLVSRRNASVQDLILHTVVVYDWTYGMPSETAASPVEARTLPISLPRQPMPRRSTAVTDDSPPTARPR
jgi:uncharacterized RDD family membrane protein YckC